MMTCGDYRFDEHLSTSPGTQPNQTPLDVEMNILEEFYQIAFRKNPHFFNGLYFGENFRQRPHYLSGDGVFISVLFSGCSDLKREGVAI